MDDWKCIVCAFQMLEVCMLNLDEGKARDWPESLKLKITQKFISESSELQDAIMAKKGVWSTVKGFFQWITTCIVYQNCLA